MVLYPVAGKWKPLAADGKVADFPDVDGEITASQIADAVTNGLILFPDSNGDLPDPSLAANQGRFAVSGNQFLHAIDRGAHDKIVVFKEYGPDRVVLTGEPALLEDEADFGGSFAVPPPIGNYSAGDYVWDYGSELWLTKFQSGSTTWLASGGPHGYAPGHLYATEAIAASHVTGVGYFHLGGVVIYGHGSAQKPYVITGYTAPGDHLWHWDPIGLTLSDVGGLIDTDVTAHDGGATSHNNIRSLVSTVEDRIDALDGLEIEAYSSTATYSRGSANSIVTHTNGLFIYISATERSSGHDPDTQPGYWLELSEGVAYEVISTGSHRIAARTIVVNGDNDNVYLCTTTQTTPRDLDYIHAQSESTGGSFILLNGAGSGGTTVTANPSGTDGDQLTRLAIGSTNYNLLVIAWGFQVDTLIVPELNQNAITTARIVLEDSGLTHYLTFLDWTTTSLGTISHLPVGAYIGLRQGVTTRILRVEAGWDSTNNRYQVINVNTGILSESSTGTATELLLTGGGGSSGGGLVLVTTTARLSGEGTSSNPLDIADGGVITAKIADDAVTGDKIADDTIHGGALIDGTIPTDKIGDDQVTGAKIADNAINAARLAEFAVQTDKIANMQVTTAKIDDGAVTSEKLAANAAGEGKVPIDDTMQFDGQGDLGVNTQRVVQEVSEWVQHFASGSAHDTSGHTGKYHEYTSSNTVRRIGSVQYDFTPDNSNGNKTYRVYIIQLTGRNVDAVIGVSEPYSGNFLQHRFHFTDGVTINPAVRIGIGLHRTDGGGNNYNLSVRSGAESQDSPRESYDDASDDFHFEGRFNHDRNLPTVGDTVGGTTAGQIYGNPEIFYQIIHTHASLVGDGTISSDHISSGSAAADAALLADGFGASAFRDVVVHGDNIVDNTIPTAKYGNESVSTGKIADAAITEAKLAQAVRDLLSDGGVTHIESGATYNNNVITVSTTSTVRGGDGILFAVPSPFGTSTTQAVSLEIDGQANSTFPLVDRNDDALHEADLTVDSVYIAISDADSWDILILPSGGGRAITVQDEGIELTDDLETVNITGTGVIASFANDVLTLNIGTGEADDETQAASASEYVTASTRIQVTLDKHPEEGDIFSFDVPADISTTSTTDISLRVTDGSTFSAERNMLGLDGSNLNPTNLIASRTTMVQRVGSNYVVLSALQESATGVGEIILEDISFAWIATSPAAGDAATTMFRIDRPLTESDDGKLFAPSIRFDDDNAPDNSRFPLPPIDAKFVRALVGAQTAWPGGGNPIATNIDGTPVQFLAQRFWTTSGFGHALWNLYYSGRAIALLSTTAALGSTTLTFTSTTGLSAGDHIFLDNERIEIVSVNSSTQLTVVATTAAHSANVRLFLDDGRTYFFTQTHNQQDGAADIEIVLVGGGEAIEGGQESPGTEGVAELTPDLVRVTFWKWVLTTDGKPNDPTAHWRFDDRWDGTTPAQGGGWYISQSEALDVADNNPAFSQDTWTLWTATEQTRRNVVNDAYTYTDGGYTVTAVWDIQYSIDGSTWTTTEPTDTYHYIRYRDQETGEFGPTIPIGTNVGNNDWQPIRTNDLVYPGGSDEDELQAAYDFSDFSELLFVAAGYRSVTVSDGMGGTMVVGVNGPWHQYVLNRGAGWPVADASDAQDNNDENDGACFQFTYFATNTGVGLMVWERGDNYVDFDNPPFLQDSGEPPRQMGGHFKIVSTDGDEAHVTKFRFFDFSHDYARININIFARYR